MIVRIVIILAVAFACLYGLKQVKNGYRRKYFTVALCGMTALLFARFFYLILCLSSGDDELMSLGVFGQSAAYLFFTTANTKFLSRKFSEELRHKPCLPALAGAVLVCTLFVAAAVKSGLLSEYLSDGILALFLGGAFYYSASVLCLKNKYAVCGYVARFNLCICVLTVINALQVLFYVIFEEGTVLTNGIMYLLAVISVVAVSLSLPVLKRGMNEWKE